MTQDIAVVIDSITGLRDMSIGDNGDLVASTGFDTSIDNSILVNQRASSEEVAQAQERRGWIGDLYPRSTDFKVGSKIWLFEQERRTQNVMNAIRDLAFNSLEWMVEGNHAERITASVEPVGASEARLTVQIFVGNNLVKRYFNLWTNTRSREVI